MWMYATSYGNVVMMIIMLLRRVEIRGCCSFPSKQFHDGNDVGK